MILLSYRWCHNAVLQRMHIQIRSRPGSRKKSGQSIRCSHRHHCSRCFRCCICHFLNFWSDANKKILTTCKMNPMICTKILIRLNVNDCSNDVSCCESFRYRRLCPYLTPPSKIADTQFIPREIISQNHKNKPF